MKAKKEHPLQWMAPKGLTFEEWEHYETSGALNIGYHQSGLIPSPLDKPATKARKQRAASGKAAAKLSKAA
jgi:hypothetical protein